jgi:hypothetical protein
MAASHSTQGVEDNLMVGFLPAIGRKLAVPFSVIVRSRTEQAENCELDFSDSCGELLARRTSVRGGPRRYGSLLRHGLTSKPT